MEIDAEISSQVMQELEMRWRGDEMKTGCRAGGD